MIGACMARQTVAPEYVPSSSAPEWLPPTPFVMRETDEGIEGHAGQRDACEDRRDDGRPLVEPEGPAAD